MTPATSRSGLVPSLCFVRPAHEAGSEGALRLLATAAVEQGYARESFVEALVEREATFPTGLPLPLPVAIPHADARHILKPGMAALVPQAPLRFGEMGSKVRTVDVHFVLMLLVNDPSQQVTLLGRLIGALRRPDLGEVLLAGVEEPEELVRRFDRLLEG
jgi:PTS system galactitol-specific IIA component